MRRSCWNIVAALAYLAIAALGGTVCAAEPGSNSPSPDSRESLRYRRIYAPADRIGEWPRGTARYLPIAREEFERLLSAANAAVPELRPASSATIAQAEYRVRLAGTHLTAGTARLRIETVGKTPAILPMEPCNLAIQDVKGEPADAAAPILGLGADGKLALLASKPGNLDLEWSCNGRTEAGDATVFDLQLPPCAVNALTIDAPEGSVLASDCGSLRSLGFVDEGVERWHLDLGGNSRVQIKSFPVAKAPTKQRLAQVVQSTLYDISIKGIEVSCQWRLSVYNEPLRSLAARIDDGLQVSGVKIGDQAAPFTVRKTPDGAAEVVVVFLDPVGKDGRVLQIQAIGSLDLGATCVLPRIRPQDVFWQEGEAEVTVHSPLKVETLASVGGRQTGVWPLAASAAGQSYRFQVFSPDATVEAAFALQAAALAATSATCVEFSQSAVAARITADVRSTMGDHFALEGDVDENWLIDSIESQPADAIEDWSVERIDGKPQLKVRFAMPVTPQRPVRLIAAAKRPGTSPEERFSPASLLPIALRAASSKQILALRAIAPYRLHLSGGEGFAAIDSHGLDAIQRELLGDAPRDLLLEPSPQNASVQIRVAAQQPAFAGNIRLEASVSDDFLDERYAFRCQPESGAVDRLRVTFATQRDQPPRWTLAERPQTPLAASRVPDARGETWEVILPEPTNEPFEVRAIRREPFGQPIAVSLAGLPEAASQRATATIRWTSAKKPKVLSNRPQPIPAESAADRQTVRLLGTYRYDPAIEVAMAHEEAAAPALLITPGSAAAEAFVWSLEMESWFGYDGAVRHAATFRLQNSGLGEMRIDLPADCIAESCDAQVDGRGEACRPEQDSTGQFLRVALDEDQRYAAVAVRFSTPSSGLPVVGSFAPPRLDANLPVFTKTWTAWLPPGYAWYGGNRRSLAVEPPAATTARRLFGPFGRDYDDPACNPLRPATWAPAITERAAQETSAQAAEQWLQAIGERLGAQGGAAAWKDIFDRLPENSPAVLIDRAAMTRLGITPQSAALVGVSAGKSANKSTGHSAAAANRAARAIQSAGLAVIVHPRALLITGQVEAALWQAWLQRESRAHFWWIDAGPLSGMIDRAAAGEDGPLLGVDAWRKQLPEAASVWTSSPQGASAAAIGWTAARVAVADEELVRLQCANSSVMRLAGLAVFAAALAFGVWMASRRRLLGFAACAAATTTLVAAEPFVPAATGALLGLLAALAYGVLRKPSVAAGEPAPAKMTPSTIAAAVPVVTSVLLICAATAIMAAAVSAAGAESPASRADYQVFIPVDENQRPTNDKLQISEDFFRELHRRAQVSAEAPHGWILGGASYRGELVKDEASDRYRIEQLTAAFDLFVFSGKTRVRIPIRREGANLAAEGATLDGEEIQVDWEPDGNALAFDAAFAGPCRLELVLRGVGLVDGFEASIPRLASSSLELIVPPGVSNVEAPSALGAVAWKASPRRLSAALGPTDRLSLRWGNGNGPNGAASAVDVEQLQWLHVFPGSLTCDVKWKFKVIEGRLRQVQILADRRLRLLPFSGDGAPQSVIRPAGPQSQSIILSWKTPVRDEAVVEAQFLLPGLSGVGAIRPPQIDVLDARATRRMLAVTVDGALEFEQQSADRTETVAVDEFSAAWGKTNAAPTLALRLAPGDAFWRLVTRPRDAKTNVEQTLSVAYGEDRAQVIYDAQLTTAGGSHFQLALAVPPELAIDRVSLLAEGTERVAHWSRNEDGHLHVFLSEATAGRQSLTLRGRLPAVIGQPQPLPEIRVEQCQLLSAVIQVFRREGVLAEIAPGDGATPIAAPSPAQTDLGRLVRAFRIDPAAALCAAVRLSPNRPATSVEQIVWLRRSADAWNAQCDSRLHVDGGELDDLRIEAPQNFTGPLRLSPGISARVLSTAGEARMLVVHPDSAIRGDALLSVAGVLGPSSGDRFIAPQFIPKNAKQVRRLLALPKLLNGRPVAWDTVGLRPADLPADFPQPADSASFDILEAFEEPCKAVLNVSDQSLGAARVRLCDISAAWQGDGSVRGTAVFDVDPGKAMDCPLQMPPGLRAVFCSVAGIAVKPVSAPGGAPRIPLSVARLPQRVEVFFEGMPPAGTTSPRRLEAPSLGDLPVDQTLWTVFGPASCDWSASGGGEPVAAWQVEMARLKVAAAVAQSAAAQSNIAPEDLGNWYQFHARRLVAAQRNMQRLLSDAPRTQPIRMARLEVEAIDQEQTQLAERLGTRDILTRAADAAPLADSPDELLMRSLDPASARVWLIARGRLDSLDLRIAPGASDKAATQRAIGAVAACAAACVVLLAAQGTFAWPLRLVRRRPYAAGIAAGLVWWLWLWPSWLGWLITAVCIVRWLRTVRRPAPAGEPPADLAADSAAP